MRLSKTKTDEILERDGVWVALRYGIEVKVARAGNPKADVWHSRLSAEDRRLFDNPTLYKGREERVNELLASLIAESILLDWRGIEDDEDQPVPFSVGTAKQYLLEYDWLRADTLEAASTRETFFRAEVQESGNASQKSSAGRRSTQKS